MLLDRASRVNTYATMLSALSFMSCAWTSFAQAPTAAPDADGTTKAPTTVVEKEILDAVNEVAGNFYIMMILSIVAGVLWCFFGWKFYKVCVFLAGLAVGYIVFYSITASIIISANPSMDTITAQWICFAVGLILGLVTGAFFVWAKVLGTGLIGFAFGFVVGVNLDIVIAHLVGSSYPNWAHYVVVYGCAVILCLIAMKFNKPLVILSTAGMGAFSICYGVANLSKTWPSSLNGDYSNIDVNDAAVWGWMAGSVVLALLGAFVQWKLFYNIEHDGKGEHKEVPMSAI